MSLAYQVNERAVLIGDPDAGRVAYFKKIFAEFFKCEVEQVTNFSELQCRAQYLQRWRLVIFTDNLPLEATHPTTLLNKYARDLSGRWGERLVGVLGTGEPPTLIGVEREPVWLRVPTGVSADSAPPLLTQHIVKPLLKLRRVWPSQLSPVEFDTPANDFKALAELDELLAFQIAEIDRTRKRILLNQQTSARLGAMADARLGEFKEWAQHVGDTETNR
jgi:hypothetical protein